MVDEEDLIDLTISQQRQDEEKESVNSLELLDVTPEKLIRYQT